METTVDGGGAPSMANAGTRTRTKGRLEVRSPRLGFDRDAGIPRHWFAKSATATHLVNGLNLLFPAGERFFVRSVRHYLERLDDPELALQVRQFFAQEGRHAHAHERYFEVMRAHGYDIDTFLAEYDRIAWGVIEKNTTPAIRLAVTVALEHFTAIMAEDALTSGDLEHVHPELRDLLMWHAVEELEHKAVAFDVLRAVAPSYPLRIFGLFFAAASLGGFWMLATRDLLRQEGMGVREALADLRGLRRRAAEAGTPAAGPIASRVFLRGMLEYVRPSFHPMDRDHTGVVTKALERLRASNVV